ncbi:TRAP transporter substrate-binding protein [Egibacter rhizosphaerae]|nr:TRAP transporter substrate-binding protein DctP [Egibacter rhizosphaerae]
MRRLLLLALALLLLVAACAEEEAAEEPDDDVAEEDEEPTDDLDDEDDEPDEDPDDEPDDESEDDADEPDEDFDPVTWTWNVSETGERDSAFGMTAEYFAEELEARTDGQITLDLHFGGALGYEAGEMIEVIGEGFVDGGDISLPHNAGAEPLAQFGALPFLHEGYDEHWEWLDELYVPEMQEHLTDDWGVMPVGTFTFGQEYLLWDEQLEDVEQLEGAEFRVLSPVHGEFWEQLGVSPLYLPVEDLATAMERGQMDGMPNSNPLISQLEAWEHYEYRGVLGSVIGSSLYGINQESFEALPDDLQDTVVEVAQEATEHGRERLLEEDEEAEQRFDEEGMTTYEVPDETIAEMRDQGEEAWWSWAEETGDEAVDLLEATLDMQD